MTDHSLSELLL